MAIPLENEELRARMADYLRLLGLPTDKPFRCRNPQHPDQHPSMSFYRAGNTVKCFSCEANYDIFDLVGIEEGLTSFREKRDRLCEIFAIRSGAPQMPLTRVAPAKGINLSPEAHKAPTQPPRRDFAQLAQRAHTRIAETDYFRSRGFSDATIENFQLGYWPEGLNSLFSEGFSELQTRHPNEADFHYFIPVFETDGVQCRTLIARARADAPESVARYWNLKGAPMLPLNLRYIRECKGNASVLFVTEGWADALSIEEAGGHGIALNGVSGRAELLRCCEMQRQDLQNARFVVSLDSDDAGRKAAAELVTKLSGLGLRVLEADLNGGYKDPNEHLIGERAGFVKAVREAEARAMEEAELSYDVPSAAASLKDFFAWVENAPTPLSTGFARLDEVLDGGLYAGLYALGAISSLGKTTFALQIADTLAAAGTDVLFFSIEMSQRELLAKSLSRITFEMDNTATNENARTVRQILRGELYPYYTNAQRNLIIQSVARYRDASENLYLIEGDAEGVSVERIRTAIEKHLRYKGKTPVIFIDYLQILRPPSERISEKQANDQNVTALKQLSRDFQTPVFVISSFNRDNYGQPVSMRAFKETGGIEYGADVLLGLQLQGVGSREFDAEDAKQKEPRPVELVMLKNRNGVPSCVIRYDFFSRFQCFVERRKV